jgi:hypothetical protein
MGLLDRQFARNANELAKAGQVLDNNAKLFGRSLSFIEGHFAIAGPLWSTRREVSLPATDARQKWAQTLNRAHREPGTITQHGRDSTVTLDAGFAERAPAALEEVEDKVAADAAKVELEAGEARRNRTNSNHSSMIRRVGTTISRASPCSPASRGGSCWRRERTGRGIGLDFRTELLWIG